MSIFASRPVESLPVRMTVAQDIFGQLTFDGSKAQLPCPAAHLHTHQDQRAATVYLDGAPTLHCFHNSCGPEIERLNGQLRREIGRREAGAASAGPHFYQHFPRPAQTASLKPDFWRQIGGEILTDAKKLYPLTVADLFEASPMRLDNSPLNDWRLFMEHLWRPSDVIWCGERWDSGRPEHARCFKTAAEWRELAAAPGPLTSPWTFGPGTTSRCKASALERRHWVLESDSLSPDDACAVFWWLREKMQLRLEAVIHSGNKSLHGWFALPNPDQLLQLEAALPHTGFDEKLFSSTQPCRVPGWKRSDKAALVQTLLFLDPNL